MERVIVRVHVEMLDPDTEEVLRETRYDVRNVRLGDVVDLAIGTYGLDSVSIDLSGLSHSPAELAAQAKVAEPAHEDDAASWAREQRRSDAHPYGQALKGLV